MKTNLFIEESAHSIFAMKSWDTDRAQLKSLVERSGKRKGFSIKTTFMENLNLLRHFYGSEKRQRKTFFKENDVH